MPLRAFRLYNTPSIKIVIPISPPSNLLEKPQLFIDS